MIYCDTSLVVTALTAERTTAAAQHWLAEHEAGGLCGSWWVETEVASAIAQKLNRGDLTAAQRATALDQWRAISRAWRMVDIRVVHFRLAGDLTSHGLRAGDALHLAVTIDHGLALATRDGNLARVAQELRVPSHKIA